MKNKFRVQISNNYVQGEIKNLISFVDNKYPIKKIDVKKIHNSINWEVYYKDLSKKERRRRENFHMSIILNADLNFPIIVTIDDEGKISNILDGLHRIKKAYMLNKKQINSYMVPETDLLVYQGEYKHEKL